MAVAVTSRARSNSNRGRRGVLRRASIIVAARERREPAASLVPMCERWSVVANQGALPCLEQHGFQLGEALGPEFAAPLPLDAALRSMPKSYLLHNSPDPADRAHGGDRSRRIWRLASYVCVMKRGRDPRQGVAVGDEPQLHADQPG